MESYLEKFVEELYANQNNGANKNQQNVYSKAQYYEFLKTVLKVIKENKDASIEELRQQLFEQSGIVEAAKALVYEKALTPGLVFSYGSPIYRETVVIGNSQEVSLNNGKIIPELQKMQEDTIFDLASVTKIYTSLSILKLVTLGIIQLNDSITRYVPEFVNLKNVTIFDLLTFRVPLITDGRVDTQEDREHAEQVLFNIRINENFDIEANPYTDMGAMVLKYVIERATNMSYYDFLKSEILEPLSLNDTHVVVPEEKIERVASTNLDTKLYNDGRSVLTTGVPKGVVYDAKARIMGQREGNLSGHAGLFSSAQDMSKLAQGVMNGQVIPFETVLEMGLNRTGKIKSNKMDFVQHLGYLCYSKNPDENNSEVWFGLSGRAFASPGWLGHKLTIDPLNNIYAFMGANRSHNRITFVGSQIRAQVESLENGRTYIELPDKSRKIDASRFAWNKHTIINPCLKLALQYKLLDEILGNQLEVETNLTRTI